MAEQHSGAKKAKIKQEYGDYRQPGTAGPDADYIIRSLDRWKLRGDGLLSK